MKKLIVLLVAACSMQFALAQEQVAPAGATPMPQKPRGTKPEMMASRHANHLQKALGLSEEQRTKTYEAMLTRFNAMHAAREKAGPNPDRKALREQTKPIRETFVQTMHGILTPEQKTKWEEHRKKMKANAAKRKNPSGEPSPAAGNGDIKKLTTDDDGIEE